VPIGGSNLRDKLLAFVEVDPANHEDIKRVIADCALTYIGFDVPAYIVSDPNGPPLVWDLETSGNSEIVGGHAVICAGYDDQGLDVVSWGIRYRMTWNFWTTFVDESYALVSPDWIEKTGKTPLGMTVAELEAAMQAIRSA
jgi:hypothetical protein